MELNHSSCSRVHAAIVHHEDGRLFLIDLESVRTLDDLCLIRLLPWFHSASLMFRRGGAPVCSPTAHVLMGVRCQPTSHISSGHPLPPPRTRAHTHTRQQATRTQTTTTPTPWPGPDSPTLGQSSLIGCSAHAFTNPLLCEDRNGAVVSFGSFERKFLLHCEDSGTSDHCHSRCGTHSASRRME